MKQPPPASRSLDQVQLQHEGVGGTLLEMQILTESETLRVGPSNRCFNRLPGGLDLRTFGTTSLGLAEPLSGERRPSRAGTSTLKDGARAGAAGASKGVQ